MTAAGPCAAVRSGAPEREALMFACRSLETAPAFPDEGFPSACEGVGSLSSLRLETAPTPANLVGLARLALRRDREGEIVPFSLEVDRGKKGMVFPRTVVRRLKARAGLARGCLEFAFEFVSLSRRDTAPALEAPTAGAFAFAGSRAFVDGLPVEVKEFSYSLNNNLFVGDGGRPDDPPLLTAGRQALVGYLCIDAERGDLPDSHEHNVRIELASGEALAVLSADVMFVWHRRIETSLAGALEVIYFEGASGGIESGLTVTLEDRKAQEPLRRDATTRRL